MVVGAMGIGSIPSPGDMAMVDIIHLGAFVGVDVGDFVGQTSRGSRRVLS
jgi:hypothetical protein